MMRPWHVIGVLALLVLAVGAGLWQTRKNDWQPPVALAPQLPALAALGAPARPNMGQALARPLLWAARRPMEQAGAQSGADSDVAKARLLAVVASGNSQIALLQRADGSNLKLTAQSQPWRLESFDGRTAVFTSAGRRVERALEHGAAPAPAAAPAKPVPVGKR